MCPARALDVQMFMALAKERGRVKSARRCVVVVLMQMVI